MGKSKKSMVIGIDASRSRSGGAKAHLIGILNEVNPEKYGIKEIHVWTYMELSDMLPNTPWLIKHTPREMRKSIFSQLYWQRYIFPKELDSLKCNIILNTDAGTIGRFQPSVTMSRDMLSYEPGEMDRYKYSLSWVRLLLLRYVQNSSLKRATRAIFLTKYASKIIQNSTGTLNNFSIIPHGVGENFLGASLCSNWPKNKDKAINCLYVSNIAPYKHQWVVIKAIQLLRNKGYNLKLTLAGGGEGKSKALVDFEINSHSFVEILGHVEHVKLPDLLSNSNLFIFASSCENMPNTLVEAMALGLPIACSDRGPMPEILENGGLYFNPENYISIANSIEKIITNSKKRDFISTRAKELSKKYSWKRCSLEIFESLLSTYKYSKDKNER